MTAKSKDEFMAAAINALAEYPMVAQFVKAGDPRVLAQLGANATMLSMLSQQVDAAMFEPFVKARDGTVMADASLKGILPLGRAATVTLQIENKDFQSVTLGAQRVLLDAKGRQYELNGTATIPSGETVVVTATQIRRRSVTKKVDASRDFYALPVNLTEDMFLNTLVVYKGTEEFTYAPDWFNVNPDQYAYQVETDELRQMWVRFGKKSVVGYGVQTGDEFTLDITECNGRIVDLAPGGQFNLEYNYAAAETGIKITLMEVNDEGAAPPSMPELRVMSRYSAIYDHNAVYLGEFEFLLRRYISGIRFLSIWNEQIEENARGPSTDNINTLFVSGLVTGMDNATFEARARSLIKRADDSYRIVFVPAEPVAVPVHISGAIAISWDRASVESQTRSLLLANYGDGAVNVSEGMKQPIKKAQINRLLREQIAAFRDDKAEYDVTITLPSTALPEHFLHVTGASLSVAVSSVDYGVSLWNQ